MLNRECKLIRSSPFPTVLIAALLGFAVNYAWAHHSAAAYDFKKTETASGTIKEVFWGAPHISFLVSYGTAAAEQKEILVSTFSPTLMSRQGFLKKDVRAGDKVTIGWHPNKNGARGGLMSSLTLSDGRVIQGERLGGTDAP